MQARLTYPELRITEREPGTPDSLTEREPKSPMIASRYTYPPLGIRPLKFVIVDPRQERALRGYS